MENIFWHWTKFSALACLVAGSMQVHVLAQVNPSDEVVKEVRVAAEKFERSAVLPSWVDPVSTIPESTNNAPAVLRLTDTQYLAADRESLFIHRVWLINQASVLESLGQLSIEFQSGYQQVKLHRLGVWRNGKYVDQLMPAKIRFLQREDRLDDGIYTGMVTASILMEDVRVGDSVEFAYSVDGANPVLGGKFVSVASWDQGIPTELRRVTLNHTVGRPITWKFVSDRNRTTVDPVSSVVGQLKRLQWQERAMPALNFEPQVPIYFQVDRRIQFSEFGNWSDVSNWASALFVRNSQLPPEIDALVKELKAEADTAKRIVAALTWVQKEVRYFSVSLDESSHRPYQPAQTVARRYGDCKDKSFLLIEILRELGIQADPVLVSTREQKGFVKGLPSPYVFDHAIVRVLHNNQSYFLDPTRQGQVGRLDALGQPYEGFDVLIAAKDSNALTTIQTPNIVELTRDELSEKYVIPKFGEAGTLEVRHTWSGVGAEVRRQYFARVAKNDLEKILQEPFESRYPGMTNMSPTIINDDETNNVLTIISKYSSPKLAVQVGGDWVLRYGAINFQQALTRAPSAQRSLPMLAFAILPQTRTYSIEVEFPDSVAVVSDPQTRTVKDRQFEYSLSTAFRGNRASATAQLRLINPILEPKDTPIYLESLRKTNDLASSVFVVRRDEIKSAGVFGLGAKSIGATIKGRLEERVKLVTRAIDGGKLTGDDLAEAYCDRSEAQNDMGQAAQAVKDANDAVKTAPNLPLAYACRGSAYFVQGDFVRSIADYSKAITLGDTSFNNFYRRGHSRFYANQLSAAQEDFAKAIQSSAGDLDSSLYAQLWQVWTLRRLGLELPQSQTQALNAQRNGAWPRPAIALLAEALTVDQVFAIVDKKKGDEKEMALVEANFYVGQYFMIRGDKVKAMEHFRKAREKQVTIYIEHVAAGHELSALGVAP